MTKKFKNSNLRDGSGLGSSLKKLKKTISFEDLHKTRNNKERRPKWAKSEDHFRLC